MSPLDEALAANLPTWIQAAIYVVIAVGLALAITSDFYWRRQ